MHMHNYRHCFTSPYSVWTGVNLVSSPPHTHINTLRGDEPRDERLFVVTRDNKREEYAEDDFFFFDSEIEVLAAEGEVNSVNSSIYIVL